MINELEKLPNESYLDFKYRVLIGKSKGEIENSWNEVFEALNIGLGIDSVKKGTIFLPEFEEYMINKLSPQKEIPNYKETIEVKRDGTTSSDKLIELSQAQMKDSEYILKAHGFDPSHFELLGAKHSVWNVSAGNNPNKTLYSSKVSVKPKVNGFNIDKFVELASRNTVEVHIERPKVTTNNLLTLPFVDLHYGVNHLAEYQEKLDDTLEIIKSKKWDTIYIPIGNDGLHVNSHKNTTANGTLIESVDLDKAVDDFYTFYTIILNTSLEFSKNVVVDYVHGNHDADLTWMLVKILAKKYPQIKWDTSMEVKKFFKWKNILLINLHGDKSLQRVSKTLLTEYRDLVVGASTVEIYSGHLHHEKVVDEFGIVKRTLPTSAKTDSWHRSMGFEGSVSHSQIFEYTPDKLKTIYHV